MDEGVEIPPTETIRERMARLKLAQVGVNSNFSSSAPSIPRPSSTTTRGRPPPLPSNPPRPRVAPRSQTVSLPVKEEYESATLSPRHDQPLGETRAPPPPILPPRLPPRQASNPVISPPTRRPGFTVKGDQPVDNGESRGSVGYRLPPPLPRSKSPSASSTYSTSSIETFDSANSTASTATDVSNAPKLPPRLPSRPTSTSAAPPHVTKVAAWMAPPPPIAKTGSWSKAPVAVDNPRKLPPVGAPLPEIVGWKKPTIKETPVKRTSITSTITGGLRKGSTGGVEERGRPTMPVRRSISSGEQLRPPSIIKSPHRSPSRNSAELKVSFGKVTTIPEPEPSPPRKVMPPPTPANRPNILQMGFGGQAGRLPSPPRPQAQPETPSSPPPVSMGNKPKINFSSKPTSATPSTNHPGPGNPTCLYHRDFAVQDAHAALFPRQNWRDVAQLSHALTSGFPSLTDKARVLFTWLHHNIIYDTVAFFANNIKPSTPASTLSTGLAVCEGYAGLFAAMALHSGLEAVVVSGHGKGFGYTPTADGRIPKYNAGHAWNAVRIDNGEWRLIDGCWGAGSLECATNTYKAAFKPEYFNQTPEQFRRKHFPGDSSKQFCTQPISWEDYITRDDGPLVYGTFTSPDMDFSPYALSPSQGKLQPHTRYTFRLTGSCEHKPIKQWVVLGDVNGEREVLREDGRGGIQVDMVTGAKGSDAKLAYVTKLNGRDGAGLTVGEYENRGPGSQAWSYLAKWEVV